MSKGQFITQTQIRTILVLSKFSDQSMLQLGSSSSVFRIVFSCKVLPYFLMVDKHSVSNISATLFTSMRSEKAKF